MFRQGDVLRSVTTEKSFQSRSCCLLSSTCGEYDAIRDFLPQNMSRPGLLKGYHPAGSLGWIRPPVCRDQYSTRVSGPAFSTHRNDATPSWQRYKIPEA